MKRNSTLPTVDYSLQPAAVIRRCGGWRNGRTDVSLHKWFPSGHLNQGDWVAKQEAEQNQPQINKLLNKEEG
ncbi:MULTISPECIES: hypothetical protein [Aeromonas]|uniref:hypothetical protein n=1 Tax=Aeromonas TaxID=642 RepID=UPI0022E040C1|nr:hypothetical protein [Aeromonas sp. QDB03]